MRNRSFALLMIGLVALFAPSALSRPQSRVGKVSYVPYQEARPIIDAMIEAAPAEIKAAGSSDAAWSAWVAKRDAEIRARLVQGDEDSMINYMLFGTSFTRRERVTLKALAEAREKAASPEGARFVELIKGRADDLISGMAAPGSNERLLFSRAVVEAKGYDAKTAPARERLKQYLLGNLARVLGEQASYAKMLESARMLGDPSGEFAERSKLFRDRGLSSDTSLMPNFAIEKSLASMKSKGLLAAGSVRRVAIIGPGLDFTDKQDGYDFYPQQTIQPFAVIDSLLRLGLARPGDLRLTTLDLSARVNDHLKRARARAAQGASYVVQLPRDSRWQPDLADYWSKFGDRIGEPAPPVAVPPALGDIKVRAVKIRPAVVSLISAEDLNVVLQRLELPAGEQFDLMIATNILVYYDVFEQSLALANVEKMLRPGGFLLSNNALLELPVSRVRSVDYETVVYSDRANDGDHIVWYQRAAK
ncbi:MAG TPA: class I SAM-dependent methyltransferase [Blastocatellia bacterium]|nr:class I SAM-dependent methyltransferase [Blastocatellia bacterium]